VQQGARWRLHLASRSDLADEAAPVLCGKLNLLRASLPDEHVGAFVRAGGPRPGEVDGGCRFGTMQAAIHSRGDCELK